MLEILVALGIFMGVVAAIYASWMAILRGSQVGREAADEAQRRRIAVRCIEEALAGAQLFAVNAPRYAFLTDTTGEYAAMSCVSRLPESFPRSGRFGELFTRRVTFQVEEDREGIPNLVMRQIPLFFEQDVDEEENPLVLARDVLLFHLEFWGAGSTEWLAEWAQTNQFPTLIRFSMAFRREGEQGIELSDVITRVVAMPVVATPPTFNNPAARPNVGRAAPRREGASP